MSDKEFWSEVYIAALESGNNDYALSTADRAVEDRNRRFPPEGKYVEKIKNGE